jgi:demethylmenaquinone methyltransferase / 2-methoxy-6-polyprenyl-1,4-benzoquinol methylase
MHETWPEDKTKLVKRVFNSVSDRYDLMNDLMSFSVHRLWKKFTVAISGVREGDYVLDIASGTGDLIPQWLKRVGSTGHVLMSDINETMLHRGRDRLIDLGLTQVQIMQADAQSLPFPDNTFHHLSTAFGLRNMTDQPAALQSMHRVLKQGGQLLVLEFSKPVLKIVQLLYDQYAKLLPKLGQWVAQDSASYQYLIDSIRKHPDQETLKRMILEAGFNRCRYYNLSAGIVALHQAWKF